MRQLGVRVCMNCGVETKSLSEGTLIESFVWNTYTPPNMSGMNYKANGESYLTLNDSSRWLFRSVLTMYWAFVILYGISSLYMYLCTLTPICPVLDISYEVSVWQEKALGACCWESSTYAEVKGKSKITTGKYVQLDGSSIPVHTGSIITFSLSSLPM